VNNPLFLILVGLFVGIYSGILGVGGGTIMIPVMVLALGFTQQRANATSLAVMIPPIMLPAVIRYYQDGIVDVRVAIWIALGVLAGSYLGALASTWIVKQFGDTGLKLTFGFVLVYIAGYTIFQTLGKQHLVRSILFAASMVIAAAAFFLIVRSYDAKNAPVATKPPTSIGS